jgi:hypothetical protein
MTDKDIEITAVALLKSVIESGAPADQWKTLLQDTAVPLWVDTTNKWKQSTKEK